MLTQDSSNNSLVIHPAANIDSQRCRVKKKSSQVRDQNPRTLRRNFLENNKPFIFKSTAEITSRNLQKSNQGEIVLEEVSEKINRDNLRSWGGHKVSLPRHPQ